MSDIQSRLSDINSRLLKAKQDRDRNFWRTVTAIWLVGLALVIAFVSAPAGQRADHRLDLYNQEQIALKR